MTFAVRLRTRASNLLCEDQNRSIQRGEEQEANIYKLEVVSRSELVNTQQQQQLLLLLLLLQAYQVHPEQVDQVTGTDNTYMSAGPLQSSNGPYFSPKPSFWVLLEDDSRCPRPRLGLLSSDQDLGATKLARSASSDQLRIPAGVQFFLVVSRGHGCPPQRPALESVLVMSPEGLLSPRDAASLAMSSWEEIPRTRHPQ